MMSKSGKTTSYPSNNNNNSILQIKSVTWNKDSHGLFDYQSRAYTQKKFKVQQSSHIMRNNTTSEVNIYTTEQLKKNKLNKQENITLSTLNIKRQKLQQCFYFSQAKFQLAVNNQQERKQPAFQQQTQKPNNINDAYMIVRSLKNNQGAQKGYGLTVGDIIKLGRIQYLVLQIHDQEKKQTAGQSFFDKQFKQIYDADQCTDVQGACRICLRQQWEQNNFFISPCKCKGSCQIVHIQCLKKWLQSKVKKKTFSFATSFNFKKFQCQICKEHLPKILKKGGKNYQLLQIQRPNGPYLILQSIANQKASKYIYILEGNPQMIKIVKFLNQGRGHQCQIRISDISVSRLHAFIKYQKGQFIIIDHNSKFGTLIKIKKNLNIGWEKFAVQIGRTVLTFILKKKDQIRDRSKGVNVNSMKRI